MKQDGNSTRELIPDASTPAYALQWLDQHKKLHNLPVQGARPRFWPTASAKHVICAERAAGKSLVTTCGDERRKSGKWMAPAVVLGWLSKADTAAAHPDDPKFAVHSDFEVFREAYGRAGRARLELDVERLIDIERRLATECQKTMHVGRDGKAQWGPNPEALDPHAARVVVDSIKWRLSKLLPQVYGDRQQLEVSGEVKVTRPSQDAPEWMQERLKEKIGKAVADEAADDPPPSSAKDEPTVH